MSMYLNLDSAVGRTAGQRKASDGAALLAISGTAEQFQMGDETSPRILKHDKHLAKFDGVNCGF